MLSFFSEMPCESRKNDTLNSFFLPTHLRSFLSLGVTKIRMADSAVLRLVWYPEARLHFGSIMKHDANGSQFVVRGTFRETEVGVEIGMC